MNIDLSAVIQSPVDRTEDRHDIFAAFRGLHIQDRETVMLHLIGQHIGIRDQFPLLGQVDKIRDAEIHKNIQLIQAAIRIFVARILPANDIFVEKNIRVLNGFAELLLREEYGTVSEFVSDLAEPFFFQSSMLGIEIIEGMRSIGEAAKTVASVAILVAGTLPLVKVIERIAKHPLNWVSQKTGIDSLALSFSLASLASILPACTMYHKMNTRGKVLIAAAIGSFANMLGPHLGFAATANQNMIVPMLAAKIAAGILAVPLALWFGDRLFKDEIKAELAASAMS